jgi:hypothetical protein
MRHFWRKNQLRRMPVGSPMFSTLVDIIGHNDIDLREMALHALQSLAEDSSNLRQLRLPALKLVHSLRNRKQFLDSVTDAEDREMYEDEVHLIQGILSKL